MKGLKISDKDLVITDNEIEMIDGDELTTQTIQSVLSTNKGEWLFNEDEGINFDNLLGKNIDEKVVKSEIEQGIKQVDSALSITDFTCKQDGKTRVLEVDFKAQSENGETLEVSNKWD